MVPECRRPKPCGCWGCINEELARYEREQYEVRPLDQLGLKEQDVDVVEGARDDGDCD